jgi:hypothetical protein
MKRLLVLGGIGALALVAGCCHPWFHKNKSCGCPPPCAGGPAVAPAPGAAYAVPPPGAAYGAPPAGAYAVPPGATHLGPTPDLNAPVVPPR